MYYKPKKCLIPEAATTRKHLHWSLFLIQLQAWRPAAVLKETPTKIFFCDYCENLKNIYFQENLQTTASYYTNIFS